MFLRFLHKIESKKTFQANKKNFNEVWMVESREKSQNGIENKSEMQRELFYDGSFCCIRIH